MNLFIVGYGLSGSFGGINNYEVIKAKSLSNAETHAWELACEYYENYVGMYGLRDLDEIIEDEDCSEEDAEEIYSDEREDWLDYNAIIYTKEDEERLIGGGYSFTNKYK